MNKSSCFRLDYILFILVHILVPSLGYSRGAPRSTCGSSTNENLIPRHGFQPQTSQSPASLELDLTSVTTNDYVRVSLRSKQAFKVEKDEIISRLQLNNPKCVQGYLIYAASGDKRVGSWTIPYGDTSCQYIHCDGLQDTVTHTDHSSLR